MPMIGQYSTIDIEAAELVKFDLKIPYNIGSKDKLSGESIVTRFNKQPVTLDMTLKYHVEYSNIDPLESVYFWEKIGDNANLHALYIGDQNYGAFLIKNIRCSNIRLVPRECTIDITFIRPYSPEKVMLSDKTTIATTKEDILIVKEQEITVSKPLPPEL